MGEDICSKSYDMTTLEGRGNHDNLFHETQGRLTGYFLLREWCLGMEDEVEGKVMDQQEERVGKGPLSVAAISR